MSDEAGITSVAQRPLPISTVIVRIQLLVAAGPTVPIVSMGLGWRTQPPEVVLRPCHVVLAIGSSQHVCLLPQGQKDSLAALNPSDFI